MMRTLVLFFFLLCSAAPAVAQDFWVLIGAFGEPQPERYFKERGLKTGQYFKTEDHMGIHRYYAGLFDTRLEADSVWAAMRARGFANAEVVDVGVRRILRETHCPYHVSGLRLRPDSTHRHLFFEMGSAKLSPSSLSLLGLTLQILRENPRWQLIIQGHSDASGSKEINRELSIARARHARDYLIDRGIRADRLLLKIYGESEPMYNNYNVDSYPLLSNQSFNRRVTLIFLNEAGQAVDPW